MIVSREPFFNGTSLGWYEASITKGSWRLACWTHGWPWFLLVRTNKTQNCDSKIVSLVESNFNFTVKTGRRQTCSQRNHYASDPMQDRMCRWLGLQFFWGGQTRVTSWAPPWSDNLSTLVPSLPYYYQVKMAVTKNALVMRLTRPDRVCVHFLHTSHARNQE